MAIYYIDPINGNNANDGLSYATAVKTIVAPAMSAVTGGDEVRFLETPEIDTGFDSTFVLQQGAQGGGLNLTAATNTSPIQITASAATGLSNGDWVYISGVIGNTAANGFWRVTVVNSTQFTLNGSTGNSAVASGGAMRKRNGSVIPLPANCVKNISMTGNVSQTVYPYNCGNWTPSTNVTCALNTGNTKQGSINQQIAIAAAFTTGKVAYQALGSAVDFSAYQAISFSLMTTTIVAIPDNSLYIALCSDTAGGTVVDRFDITNTTATFGSGMPSGSTLAYKFFIQKQGGGNLGSNIQSIALYAAADPGTVTVQLDNIVAVKAENDPTGISIRHIVNNGIVTDGYWGLGAVWNDAEVGPVGTFDTASMSIGSTTGQSPYWAGTAGTRRLYKILPINAGAAGTNTQDCWTIPFNSVTTPITISGGWSAASSMSTKTGRTALATTNGAGRLFVQLSKNGFLWSSMILCYCNLGMNISGNYGTSYTDMHFSSCQTGIAIATTLLLRNGVIFGDDATAYPNTYAACSGAMTITSCFGAVTKYCHLLGSGAAGLNLLAATSNLFENCRFRGSATNPTATIQSGLNKFVNCEFSYGAYGVSFSSTSSNSLLKNCTINQNTTAGVNFTSVYGSTIQTCTFSSSNQNVLCANSSNGVTVIGGNLGSDSGTPYYLNNQSNLNIIGATNAGNFPTSWAPAGTVVNFTNVSNNGATIYYSGQTELYTQNIQSASGNPSETHAAGPLGTTTGGQKIILANYGGAGSRGVNNKAYIPFGRVNCTANKTVTVTGWLRCVTGTGSDFAQLAVIGGTIAGVPNDVESSPTSNTSWLQHSISFTPTESGVVQVYALFWGARDFFCDGLSATIVP